MRKLLMATAAILGATGGMALAQTAAPSQGQYIGPYGAGPAANNNNNIWGAANTPSGSPAVGGFATLYAPNTDAAPTPGTIVIRLNGRVETGIALNYAGNTGAGAGTVKYNPVSIPTFMRLYPGFDGLSANGMRYGAAVELRENFASTTNGGAPTLGGNASANSSQQTVYVRRSFVYFGSDQVGIVRLGQADGVISIFDPCIFTSVCWDPTGSVGGNELQSTGSQGSVSIPLVWLSGQGAEYANSKIVYLSPQVFGFDFGLEYDPNQGNGQNGGGACGAGSVICSEVTTGPGVLAGQWDNKIAVGVRYMNTFGPVDFKAFGTYVAARALNNTAAGATKFDNLSFGTGGIAITAMGVTVAADYIGGHVNNQQAAVADGGKPTNAVITGVSYHNGPLSIGANVGIIDMQGVGIVGKTQEHDFEVNAGGSYSLAPGFTMVAEYMYQQRHAGGHNFYGGAAATGDIHSNGMLLATVVSW